MILPRMPAAKPARSSDNDPPPGGRSVPGTEVERDLHHDEQSFSAGGLGVAGQEVEQSRDEKKDSEDDTGFLEEGPWRAVFVTIAIRHFSMPLS